jgi:hypothetical protein
MEEISGRIGTKTLDSLDKMTERSLRGPATNNTDRLVRGGRVILIVAPRAASIS